MSSGVTVTDEVVEAYSEIKMGKTRPYRYLLFKISDDLKSIKLAEKGDRDSTFDQFRTELLEIGLKKEARYCVYDHEYTNKDNATKTKLCLITWIPDTLAIKTKMLYTSSKDALKKKLEGVAVHLQCNEEGDLDENELTEKAENK